jgi:hypothetical protein
LQTNQLTQKLNEIWAENSGCVNLFNWLSFLKEESVAFLGLDDVLDISEAVLEDLPATTAPKAGSSRPQPVTPKCDADQPVNPKLEADQPVNPKFEADQPVNPKCDADQPVTPKCDADQPVNPKSEKLACAANGEQQIESG